ncbi:response regulator [Celeribacter sp.]|uniref:response regulator n=1 Tax=Celeribacter sp. TaxID=1890673 RepID=UPI003A8F6E3D
MKRTILCVEDERHLRQDIIEELIAAGYEAVGAATGREALSVLDTTRPDLILCDICMPQLDGHGFLKTLRSKRPDLADVPLVFLTALDGRDAIIGGKRAGADDYLVKPVDYDLMLATIEARLREVNRIDQNIQELRQTLSAAQSSGSPAPDALHKVFELLSFGVVLLSSTQVVFANRVAREIHRMGDGLSVDTGIRCDAAQISTDMRDCWRAACEASTQGRDYLSSLAIPRLSGGRDYHLTFCALEGAFTSEGDAQCVAFITDPQCRPAVPAKVLADIFNLTPTEAEVAQRLALGLRSDEIASDLAIAPTTVAFHLSNIFDKTGTRRQAELIVLLLTGLTSIDP